MQAYTHTHAMQSRFVRQFSSLHLVRYAHTCDVVTVGAYIIDFAIHTAAAHFYFLFKLSCVLLLCVNIINMTCSVRRMFDMIKATDHLFFIN